MRQSHRTLDQQKINDLLKQKKVARENTRNFNLKLLNKKNSEIKNRKELLLIYKKMLLNKMF